MKRFKLSKKATIIGLAVMLAVGAVAQFAVGPRIGIPIAIPAGGFLLGNLNNGSTNVPSPTPFGLTANQLKFYLDWGATNASTGVSNVTFRFQVSADGSKWISHGGLDTMPTLAFTIPGPGGGEQTYTNLFDAATVSGWRFIRLHSISNFVGSAESNHFYITNMYFSQF